jgi:hypothetical protein
VADDVVGCTAHHRCAPDSGSAFEDDNLGAGLGGFDGGTRSSHPRTDDRIGAAPRGNDVAALR